MAAKPDAVPAVSRPAAPPSSFSAVIARLYWMAFGHIGVLAGLFRSARSREVGVPDLVFWAFGFSIILVRYLDVAHLHGRTSEGQPATLAHWRRFSVGMLVVLAALWGLARLVAPLPV